MTEPTMETDMTEKQPVAAADEQPIAAEAASPEAEAAAPEASDAAAPEAPDAAVSVASEPEAPAEAAAEAPSEEPAPAASNAIPAINAAASGHRNVRPNARSDARRHATSGPIPISSRSGRPKLCRKKL